MKCQESVIRMSISVSRTISNQQQSTSYKIKERFYCVVTRTTKCIISLRQIEQTIIKFSCLKCKSNEFVKKISPEYHTV